MGEVGGEERRWGRRSGSGEERRRDVENDGREIGRRGRHLPVKGLVRRILMRRLRRQILMLRPNIQGSMFNCFSVVPVIITSK